MVEIKLLALVYFDLDSGWWRYVGMSDLRDITKASLLSLLVIYLFVTFVTRPGGYPRSVYVIDFILTIFVIAGARVFSSFLHGGCEERNRAEEHADCGCRRGWNRAESAS